jgi:hypothetical protein
MGKRVGNYHKSCEALPIQGRSRRRKKVSVVAGETLREISILVAVFYMLDALMEYPGDYSLRTTIAVLACCILEWDLAYG